MIPTIDRRTTNINSDDLSSSVQHDLHPTSLEQFMACPFKFHVQEHPELFPNFQNLFGTSIAWREAFYEWDITEQLMTAYQYWNKLWDQVLINFWNSTEFPLYQRLKKHADNRKEFMNSNDTPKEIKERYPLFTQKRMTLDVLMDADNSEYNHSYKSHEIHLVWTADRVYSDYTIADCKTSKSKWWKNEPDFRLQWRLYPWMRRQTSNLPQLKNSPNFTFTYFVFTKQVTPQLQIIPLTYSYEDSERLIFHLLHEYVKAYDNDNRQPKKCLWCKWCPLRTQCPLYWEDWMASTTNTDTTLDDENDNTEWRF